MLTVRGLCKSFGSRRVLDGVDLDLPEGESLVVIGGSGTGKSVLLRCILGLEAPDAGSIMWNGAAIGPDFMDRFGMLFQNAALFDSLPVWRNVAFRLLRTLPKAQARAIALDKLARVGLGPEVADLYPAALSGGMRKRAGLARAIAADPAVIFFDEPTTGLDPITSTVIEALIVGLTRDTGATSIVVTHQHSTIFCGDMITMLYQGKVVGTGTPDEMRATQIPLIRNFLDGIVTDEMKGD